MIEDQSNELLRYEESIRREREEEEHQRAKAKKKKKRRHEIKDDYLDDFPPRRNDRRIPDRDRMVRRRVVEPDYGKHAPDFAPSSKRRRGGEVGLANILETIVETLKARTELSYLFLKPVTRKEAPDYLDFVDRPMDLSTIRDKTRRMEYKSLEDFRHDVHQIAFNAHAYNDRRNPDIPPLADQLLELCDFLIGEYDTALKEAESGIE